MDDIAQKLEAVFMDCLFTPEETAGGKPEAMVIGEGVRHNFGFHPERLEGHRAEVEEIVAEMTPEFFVTITEGSSFLRLCMDRNGHQWGEHQNVEQLTALAAALKLGSYTTPREKWHEKPGGLPFFLFTRDEGEASHG